METAEKITLDPSKIMQVGTGFFGTKTLLTAVNMDLFTILAKRELSGKDIQSRLSLHSRSLYDFLDALVAMGFLKRKGLKESALYGNAEDADFFLDKNKPTYIGGILEMCNNRLYPFWNNLEDGLKTGLPQNETKNGGKPIFEAVYADPKKLREFVGAMAGVQMGNFIEFAKAFNFSNYKTLCDIGGAGGFLAAHVAMNNQHMQCTSMDLPQVEPIAKENVQNMGLKDKVKITSGDFFTDDFPKSDIITMGNILHDWGTKDKKALIKKAYDALPKGGAFVVIENIIDNERSKNAFGLLMSLNMLIETAEGYDFSASDFNKMALEAGFKSTSLMPLKGPTSAAIAIK
ncbi:methyltransferase domain-containing protein [Arenibacter sp. TNZ]|jgi:precorrin-6B methylase 2|uniref:methyltransferase n=1 Tax=Arenibacter TaxID=178469 RepID=UPI000CD3B9DC|nr:MULTISPECIES: methyltransferase [Arenibacter]MCM4171401.1 methyltransferase domain-containing protein [Arenibacter sp. TNZ]